MFLSAIIILISFITLIILIITERLNRAIASLAAAIITYFVLVLLEGYNFSIVVDLMFSSQDDDFVNLHSLILIIGMMIVVNICHEAGTFQLIAVTLIKLSGGKPIRLMVIFCCITVFISAILNNILTVIIIIPLTITVSRILNINPSPYILTQAILVNIGGTIFSISSIPNILITTFAGLEFLEFFINMGFISMLIFLFTLLFFILLYKNELPIPEEGISVLKEINVWNFVQNKRLLVQSLITLIILLILLAIIPSSLISPDLIAITIAIILIIITKIDPKEVIYKIDFELLFYLLGVFIIVGGLEITGVTSAIGKTLLNLGGNNLFFQLLLIMWFSAYLSSCIDNIPITKILIPVADKMTQSAILSDRKQIFYSLAFGANWGDNLTPLGDNILVVNIAEQNKRPISFKSFFKLGFVTANYQLMILSIYYTIIFNFQIGIIIVGTITSSIIIFYCLHKFGPKKVRSGIGSIIIKVKNIIIR